MFRNGETCFWAVLAALGLASIAIDCGGPEAFRSLAGTGGHAGVAGAAGTAGAGATGDPIDAGQTGAAGDTPPLAGSAGDSGLAGAGTAGAADAGAAGATSAAGADGGIAGGGMSGAGDAGMSAGGGAGGKAGTGGTPDAGTDTGPPPGCNCTLKVVYQCRQNGPSVLQAEYSLKVVNTGTTSIALNNVSVRYWYTIDGTGAQAGVCASMAHPCTIAFQSPTANKANADQYAVISFAGGTLAPGADTGEVQVTMHGSGNYNQTNDYSFDNTGANYLDEMHITGYVSGKLIWGAAP